MKQTIAFYKINKGSVAVFLGNATFIVNSVTGAVTTFASPTPTLAAVQAGIDNLTSAEAAAKVGGKTARLFRDDKRLELLELLKQLGVYVELVAMGDRAISSLAGYALVKIREALPFITSVGVPTIEAGPNAGDLIAKIAKVEGASSYKFLVSTDAAAPLNTWASYDSNTLKRLISGLNSATRYYIRVCAVGKDNQCVTGKATTFVTQ
jgi:hypothetical protein